MTNILQGIQGSPRRRCWLGEGARGGEGALVKGLGGDVKLITARKRSLGQGNIFTPVCHSVHRGGGVPDQVPPPGPGTPPGTRYTLPGPGTPPRPDQGDTVYVRAVRRNAFLFFPYFPRNPMKLKKLRSRKGAGRGSVCVCWGGSEGVCGWLEDSQMNSSPLDIFFLICFAIARPTAHWYFCERKVSLIAFAAAP